MSGPAPQQPAPRGMIRIGSIAGTDVLVSTSWFVIAALIAVMMGPRVDSVQPGLGGWKYVVGLAFAIALYGAILLHEASHAVVARHYDFKIRAITLHFLGGATEIEGEARAPRQEFWIAVVGPITSLGVGAAALGLWFVVPDGLLQLVIEGLAGANLLIGVLNLVPGLPLDGGRVLKAGVWAATGKAYAGTVAAAWGGRLTAIAVGVVAVTMVGSRDTVTLILLLIVAIFLWTGAGQALAAAKVTARMGDVIARDLARRTLAVPDDLPLAEALRRAHDAGVGSVVTVTSSGRPVGVMDQQAAEAVPEERKPWVPIATVARTISPGLTLPESVRGEELLGALRATPASEYVLLAADGSVYGVLATADVVRAVRGR